VAFEESKAAGGTPAAYTDFIEKDQRLLPTGGALKTGMEANLFSDIVFEPPFVDGLSYKGESITPHAARQGILERVRK